MILDVLREPFRRDSNPRMRLVAPIKDKKGLPKS